MKFIIIRFVTGLIAISVLIFFPVCTTQAPSGPTEGRVSIELSLYSTGVSNADFTGTPITAIISISDSVTFGQIDWQLGAGKFIRPDISKNEAFTFIKVPLHWNQNILPESKDSVNNIPYDTIFLKIGPDRSNIVKVRVINRAPVVDSLIAGDTTFSIGGDIFSKSIYIKFVDTTGKIDLMINAHDFDGDYLKASWRSLRDSALIIMPSTMGGPLNAVYKVPKINFIDSVMINIYDGKLGNVELVLVLKKTSGVDPIKITKIEFGNIAFADAVSVYTVKAIAFNDTSLIKIFYESLDAINISWVSDSGNIMNTDGTIPANEQQAKHFINDQGDTLISDTTVLIDKITVTLTNSVGDMSTKQIRLVKIPVNKSPVIDSVKVDTVVYTIYNDLTGYQYTTLPNRAITLSSFAHDPDGNPGTVQYSWEGGALGILSDTLGNTVTYTTPGYNCIDSVFTVVEDALKFRSRKKIVITVFENRWPEIKMITVDDSVFVPSSPADTVFYFSTTVPDTFTVSVVAIDPDTAFGDSCICIWKYRNLQMVLETSIGKSFTYMAADTVYSDTIICKVIDLYGFERRCRIFSQFTK